MAWLCKALCAVVQLGLALLTCTLRCYHDDARRARPTPYGCYGNSHSFFGPCLRARCISQLVMAGGWWEWVWVSALVLIKPEAPRLQEKITQISGCPPLQRFGNICSCRHGLMAALPSCWGPNTDLKLHKPRQTHTSVAGGPGQPNGWETFSNTFGERRWEFGVWEHVVGLSLPFCSSNKNEIGNKRSKISLHRSNIKYLNVHCLKEDFKARPECHRCFRCFTSISYCSLWTLLFTPAEWSARWSRPHAKYFTKSLVLALCSYKHRDRRRGNNS